MSAVRFVITAGPTREHIDPVRFLSNPSTGKMGFAIATEAVRRGFDVTLVSGPVSLKTPKGVMRVDVVSAREMFQATVDVVRKAMRETDVVFIATAAVADWRPVRCAKEKLKKTAMSSSLQLVRNPDILKSLNVPVGGSTRLRKVGFAAETNDVLVEAMRKCHEKGLEFIVANDVTKHGCGFGTDTDRVAFVFPDGSVKRFPLMTKRLVAKKILDEIACL